MIFVYEPYATKFIHYEFNKALLISLLNIDNEIIFMGSRTQFDKFQNVPELQSIKFINLKIPNYDKPSKKIYKIFQEFYNLIKIKWMVRDKKLLISNALPQTLIFSRYLFKKKNNIFFILHGQLEFIANNNLKITNMNYYMKKSLMHLPKEWKLIVLGKIIKDNAIKIMPDLEKNLYYIDHPYVSKYLQDSNCLSYNPRNIKIGTIGVGLESKGILQLNTICQYLIENNLHNISILHIGKTSGQIRSLLNENVQLPFKTDSLIPENEYLREINKLDYILFLMPNDSYKLTASGSLLEAFSLGKPIIILENDFFKYILDKQTEVCGFCKRNMSELLLQIKDLTNITEYEYEEMRKNVYKCLEYFSPETVSKQLKHIFED